MGQRFSLQLVILSVIFTVINIRGIGTRIHDWELLLSQYTMKPSQLCQYGGVSGVSKTLDDGERDCLKCHTSAPHCHRRSLKILHYIGKRTKI
jgi:hypothetical protein